jgi:hypothetical protein
VTVRSVDEASDDAYNTRMRAGSSIKEEYLVTRDTLRLLKPMCRVAYEGWRGDHGEGVLLRFVNYRGEAVTPEVWGTNRLDALIVRRDASADEGCRFLPFVGDGDRIWRV